MHNISIHTKFIEASVTDADRIANVIVIKEGLGNLKDCNYYSKQALKSIVPLLESVKIYADHPTKSEIIDRPERSVRDIIGSYKNVKYAETDDGVGSVTGQIKILSGEPYLWAWAQIREAAEFSYVGNKFDFIGISINASGPAIMTSIDKIIGMTSNGDIKKKLLEAKNNGKTEVFYVTNFESVESADLVTSAGAGGKILSLKEGDKKMNAGKFETLKNKIIRLFVETEDNVDTDKNDDKKDEITENMHEVYAEVSEILSSDAKRIAEMAEIETDEDKKTKYIEASEKLMKRAERFKEMADKHQVEPVKNMEQTVEQKVESGKKLIEIENKIKVLEHNIMIEKVLASSKIPYKFTDRVKQELKNADSFDGMVSIVKSWESDLAGIDSFSLGTFEKRQIKTDNQNQKLFSECVDKG